MASLYFGLGYCGTLGISVCGDAVGPVITQVAPIPTNLLAPGEALRYTVEDPAGLGLSEVVIWILYKAGDHAEVAYDGEVFRDGYSTSTEELLPKGFAFMLRKTDKKWMSDFTVYVLAVDTMGNSARSVVPFELLDPIPRTEVIFGGGRGRLRPR